jgi:hypothetical protein
MHNSRIRASLVYIIFLFCCVTPDLRCVAPDLRYESEWGWGKIPISKKKVYAMAFQ